MGRKGRKQAGWGRGWSRGREVVGVKGRGMSAGGFPSEEGRQEGQGAAVVVAEEQVSKRGMDGGGGRAGRGTEGVVGL